VKLHRTVGGVFGYSYQLMLYSDMLHDSQHFGVAVNHGLYTLLRPQFVNYIYDDHLPFYPA